MSLKGPSFEVPEMIEVDLGPMQRIDDVSLEGVNRPPRPVTKPNHEALTRTIDIVPGLPDDFWGERTTVTYSNGEVKVTYAMGLTSTDYYVRGTLEEVRSELHAQAANFARACVALRKEGHS